MSPSRVVAFSRRLGILALIAALPLSADERTRTYTVELRAGKHDRLESPVALDLPDELSRHRHFRLTRTGDGKRIATQLRTTEPPQLAWLIDAPLKAGQSRRYRLEALDGPEKPQGRQVTASNSPAGQILLSVGNQPVLRYRSAVVPAPPGLSDVYRRSGYVHPLYNPAGQEITDDFPPDHPHQHAIFLPWVNTTFEGRAVNFWDQQGNTGRIEHGRTLARQSGPVFAQFRVQLRHLDLTAAGQPKPVLDETWMVQAYNLSRYFLVDLESRQTCSGPSPLTVNKHYYGGLAIRGNRQWFDPQAKRTPRPEQSGHSGFLTSQGRNRNNGNLTRPRWVDMFGRIDGKFSGVAIMGHPGNFRFPQHVRLHPTKPYFCFAPMVEKAFRIEPGQVYLSRYRYFVHLGQPDVAECERIWRDFADPPVVTVTPEQ